MKWFKHISDSISDPFIFDLMTRFGSDGYLVFFGILEIYAREFKPEVGWKLEVTRAYLKQKFIKRQDTLIINSLKHIQNSGKWEIEINGDQITIYIPKFKELLDNWTAKQIPKTNESLRSNDVESIQPIRIKNKEADKEEELNKANKGKDAFLEELKKAIDETKFRYPLPKEQYEIENWIKCHIRGANKKAIIHSINSLVKAPEKIEKIPFYLDAVFKMENQNYNAIEHEQKSAEYKKHDLTGLRAVLNNIVR